MKIKGFKTLIAVMLSVLLIILSGCTEDTSSAPSISFPEEDIITAYFLDVGQGDSSFFELPDGKTLLVDGANPGDGDEISEYIKNLGWEKIDFLVATHPHADHIGGLDTVIEEFEIGEIFAPKIASEDIPTTKTYERFLLAVKNKGMKMQAARAGKTLFEGEDYKAECLAPATEDADNLNNYSVVFKLTYGNQSFLLTGDAESSVEKEILESGADINCDILKVPHHGSSTSNTLEFLQAASPKVAIISCGADNSYGHPHKEPLERLESLIGSKNIYRTDTGETITVKIDGKKKILVTPNGGTVVEG